MDAAQTPHTSTRGTTLVTGASSGIGRELALQLAAAGTRVLALGRDMHRLQDLARRHPGIAPVGADLARLESLPALAAQVLQLAPDLDRVVHNAGVQCALRFDDLGYGVAQIDAELAINLHAPVHLTHALLPHLRRQPRAQLVFITSGLAYAPKRTAAVYSASKAGLQRFAQALRVQLAEGDDQRVQVVEAVMPLVDTPMTAGRTAGLRKWPADRAAAAVLHGLARGQETIHVGPARALPWLQRLSPPLLAYVLQRG